MMTKLIKELQDVEQKELDRAVSDHGLFRSCEEAHHIVLEEWYESMQEYKGIDDVIALVLDDLRSGIADDVTLERAGKAEHRLITLSAESIQTAAMLRKTIESVENTRED